MKIYDENNIYLHDWLFGGEGNFTFIQKEYRKFIRDEGYASINSKEIKVVDLQVLCESMGVECNLTNINKIAYKMDGMVYDRK